MWCNGGGRVYHQAGLTDLRTVAQGFFGQAPDKRVWLLHGEMGSGKTTLIKAMCQVLGVVDSMSSPTFSIINEYLLRDKRSVFHFDFYRIKHEAEAYDIGAEEYFYSGQYCFVEWPEKIPSLIPTERAEISITTDNETQRTIALSVHD